MTISVSVEPGVVDQKNRFRAVLELLKMTAFHSLSLASSFQVLSVYEIGNLPHYTYPDLTGNATSILLQQTSRHDDLPRPRHNP